MNLDILTKCKYAVERYQMFLWIFDKKILENAKNHHFLAQNVQIDNDFWQLYPEPEICDFLFWADRSITRYEHFMSNIGDFWLFLKFFCKKCAVFCPVML